MYSSPSLRPAWKGTVFSLILISLLLSSRGHGVSITVTESQTISNPALDPITNSMTLRPTKPMEVHVTNIVGLSSDLFITTSGNTNTPITFSLTDSSFHNGLLGLQGVSPRHSMYNFSRITELVTIGRFISLFYIIMTTSINTTIYISDHQATGSGSLVDKALYLPGTMSIVKGSGVYLSRFSSSASRYFVEYGGTQSWETISLDNVDCSSCERGFFRIIKPLITPFFRLINCTQKGNYVFFNATGSFSFGENSGLVLSNVTCGGPLFFNVTNSSNALTSTSKLTLHNVTASSLYATASSAPLFSSVPKGAQVYVGPFKLGSKTYSSLSDYQGLKLPFTRVIDMNRKVLFIASGSEGSDKVGDNSPAQCALGGFSKVDLRMNPSTKTKEPMCICNAGRFVPHCSSSWDPLGISLCPTRTTVSETTYQCIPCDIDYCEKCTVASKCSLCESGYVIDDQNKCTIPAANCKVPVSGSSTQCSVCQSGYSVSVGKKCVQSISNCKTYTDSGLCTSCQGTLSPSLSGTSCVDCTIAGCTVCHADAKCSTCGSKYSLVDEKCVACNLENCVRCEEPNQCKECEDRFKVSGTSCVEKTCDKPPCTSCTTLSGDEDICLGCTSPHQLNPLTQQCDACIDNYKLDGDTCIEKTCAKPPSTGCNSVSGNEDISVGCTPPHVLNPSTQQCDACIDNYKLEDDTCIEKTCAKAPCTGCDSPSGNTDTCKSCPSPFAVNPLTQQCDACIDNYKLEDDTCIEKTCAKPPSTGCNSVSGNEDISIGCTSPHQLNPSTQQCDACIDNYKLEDDTCIEKTCAKPPSTGCNSVSGNEDISVGCTSPHQLNPSTQQCDTCIDNYKLDSDTCVEKTCAKPPSTGCNSVSGNEDISVGCISPHQLNPSTQQCDACIDNYKLDGESCIEKTCAKPPSTGCNSVSGNEDISVGCTSPHVLNSSTQQCDACEPGLKYIQENVTCVEKQCLVANCSKCVFDQEYQCDSCGDGLQLDGDSQCSAVKDDKKVSTGMLIGIIIAIVAVVVIAGLLVFFLCCRKQRRSYEAVEHVEMKNMPAVKGNEIPSVEVEEETEVTIIQPGGDGDERNPLAPTEEANEPPIVSGGRRARRTRNVRRAQAEIADVDLDGMYSKDNEIQEDL